MPAPTKITPAAKRELRNIGIKLKRARLLRRLPMDLVAERAGTSRPTLKRIETGDPNVRIATYLMVMQALGILKGLKLDDTLDAELSNEQLPIRIRRQ
jgi:transcriptional regulator with XRE-family HTH domain